MVKKEISYEVTCKLKPECTASILGKALCTAGIVRFPCGQGMAKDFTQAEMRLVWQKQSE